MRFVQNMKRCKTPPSLGLLLGLCSCACIVPAARCDDAPAAAPAEQRGEGAAVQPNQQVTTTLGEVVVTATKRKESQRKLAETVDVLKGKDLEDLGAREMEDYLKYIPGITLEEGDTNNNRTLAIRGIGPQPGSNTTVGVLIDDVPMSDPYQSFLVPDLDPFDLQDLEVLKGPQGTLFGASALVGAIRYVLAKPLLGEWEAKGFADWMHIQGAGSGMTYGGAVNIPIGDTIALRAVDVVQETPGLYSDVNADGKNIRDADNGYKRMHRFLGTWEPTERLSVNAVFLQQSNYRNDLSVANNLNGNFTRTDTPGPSYSHQNFAMANLDVRYNFDWGTLVSETSHNHKLQNLDYDASAVTEPLAVAGIDTLHISQYINSNQVAQELRLMSPAKSDSPWVWVGGIYFNRYSGRLTENIYLGNTSALASAVNNLGLGAVLPQLTQILTPTAQGISVEEVIWNPISAQEESLFGEVTRKLFSNRVAVTLGGRAYHEFLNTTIALGGADSPYGLLNNYEGYRAMKADGFNPKATLTWQATDNIMWYANASHGFQFGGLNNPATLPEDNTFALQYKPSTLWSYETGLRTDWLHKTLQFDVTPFLINWKDMQITEYTADGVNTYTENVGRARSKGVETSIHWLLPIRGLILSNAASYIHAKVAEGYVASGVYIPTGADLPQAPRLQDATTLTYNTILGPVRTGVSATWSHQGHAFNNINHDLVIFRYNTLAFNYNLALPHVFLAPELTMNLTNVLNAHGLTYGQIDHVGNVQLNTLGTFVRPRTIDLRISGHF